MAASLFFGTTTLSSPAALPLLDLKTPATPSQNQSAQYLAITASATEQKSPCRRHVLGLAASLLIGSCFAANCNATLVDDLLAKSAENKVLNDKKRLATSGANVARAYTVTWGTCKFPENFTGCQDLAKTKNVPYLTEDLKLECEGKDKHKCGSNVFWKW